MCARPCLVEDPTQGHVLARRTLREQHPQPHHNLLLQNFESIASKL